MSNTIKDKDRATEVDVSSIAPSTQETPADSSSQRRKSWFSFRRKSNSGEQENTKRKEKRESMSDRGAFRTEMRNGVPIAVENTDWPPGVSYKTTSLGRQLQSNDGSLGGFYENQGAVAPGGETAANTGPDPDWVPGLSEEEKKKLRSDKSGRYGKFVPGCSMLQCSFANV